MTIHEIPLTASAVEAAYAVPEGSFKYCAREVVGVLASEQNLQAAVDELLLRRGIDRSQISVLAARGRSVARCPLRRRSRCAARGIRVLQLARRARDRGGGAADPRCWRGQLRRDPLVGRHACTRHDRASARRRCRRERRWPVCSRSPAAIVSRSRGRARSRRLGNLGGRSRCLAGARLARGLARPGRATSTCTMSNAPGASGTSPRPCRSMPDPELINPHCGRAYKL